MRNEIENPELIELGASLARNEFAMRAAEAAGGQQFQEAYDQGAAIVRKIERIPATSIEGLLIKARAVAWCCGGEAVEAGFDATTDQKISFSIVRDILNFQSVSA